MAFFGVLFLIIIALGAISIVIWSLINGISPMPSSSTVKDEILNNIPEHLSGTLYELGSGWGTLAFPLGKKFPQMRVEAFENSPVPFMFCILRKLLNPVPNLYFYRRDFFNISLRSASAIVCYLYPDAMARLEKKFSSELPVGCIIVSNTFAIPSWKPIKVIEVDDLYHTKVYIYKKGSHT